MPELLAPVDELAALLQRNVSWEEVAAEYGYRSGRQARNAALAARSRLEA